MALDYVNTVLILWVKRLISQGIIDLSSYYHKQGGTPILEVNNHVFFAIKYQTLSSYAPQFDFLSSAAIS